MAAEVRNGSWDAKRHGLKYQNLVLLFIGIIVATYILIYRPAASIMTSSGIEQLGYVAAFVYGMMYAYAITTAPSAALIFSLGKTHLVEPLLIAVIGASGAVLSDYLIFRFVRDGLMGEIRMLEKDIRTFVHRFDHHGKNRPNQHFHEKARIWKAISKSKAWNILVPVVAGLIIASPLPDEFGAAIFGAIRFDSKKFLVVAYFLNFIGIFVISYLGSV